MKGLIFPKKPVFQAFALGIISYTIRGKISVYRPFYAVSLPTAQKTRRIFTTGRERILL